MINVRLFKTKCSIYFPKNSCLVKFYHPHCVPKNNRKRKKLCTLRVYASSRLRLYDKGTPVASFPLYFKHYWNIACRTFSFLYDFC